MRYTAALISLMTCFVMGACMPTREKADLIITNGVIYTADSLNSQTEAMAVRDGKILATGKSGGISAHYQAPQTIDLKGKSLFPGFIDAHCHFLGYALAMQYVDLNGASSFEEVLARLQKQGVVSGTKWLVGRGWDQNLWTSREFPDNEKLDKLFPHTPVMLIRVDGHVVLANREALALAGIGTKYSFGDGQVAFRNGKMTGILSETAADLMRAAVPRPAGRALAALVEQAQQNCFAVGLTCVSDAGLEYSQVMEVDSLQKSGLLKMQVYAMLAPTTENLLRLVRKGTYVTENLVVRSIKIYADGSLGSRTARLKSPYTDDPSTSGIMVTSRDSVLQLCRLALEHGYQVNTHCIGDSAASMILNIYAALLKGKNDLRWRIEHAQVVDPADVHFFGDYSVIPSVQATHATSDMKWAGSRLGPCRVKGAYAYKTLMDQNGWIANGTDFPIENISPFLTFYAAVSRQDAAGFPAGGFQPENSLSRSEALHSITLWAARAGFLEKRKGSLEAGKDADFVITDRDIMQVPVGHVPETRVLSTYIKGLEVFKQ